MFFESDSCNRPTILTLFTEFFVPIYTLMNISWMSARVKSLFNRSTYALRHLILYVALKHRDFLPVGNPSPI